MIGLIGVSAEKGFKLLLYTLFYVFILCCAKTKSSIYLMIAFTLEHSLFYVFSPCCANILKVFKLRESWIL